MTLSNIINVTEKTSKDKDKFTSPMSIFYFMTGFTLISICRFFGISPANSAIVVLVFHLVSKVRSYQKRRQFNRL